MALINDEKEPGMEISFEKIFKILKKVWLPILIAAAVLTTVVAVVYSTNVYQPVYSSSSQYYLSNISTDNMLYSSGQTSAAEAMANYCMEFVRGGEFLRRVKQEMDKQEMETVSVSRMQRMISANRVEGSALFTVTVSGANPELNFQIAKTIEKMLPVYCDYMNNQITDDETKEPVFDPEKMDFDQASKTVKINTSAEVGQTSDNSGTLYQYPLITFVAVNAFGYLIAFLYYFIDVSIQTEQDIRDHLSEYPVLGVIPRWGTDEKKKKQLFPAFSPKEPDRKLIPLLDDSSPFLVTEAFHQLRTNVTFCSNGEKGCTVGVVSSHAAFGKTLLMSNLAVSLSHMIDKKVLLVDGDMRCSAVHQFFEIENKTGLSNLLAGQVEFNDAVHHYSDSLDVLTAGNVPPNPIELLSCKKMQDQMEVWKKQYDYVLLDLPPVGEVADALSVAPLLSGFLFVMRSGYANARVEKRITDLMEEKNAKLFGYVLTDVEQTHRKKYGYGYYYYGNYYYSHHEYKKPDTTDKQENV